ncbi:MAG: TIGR03915 family putative DNA repair protein [Sulfurovum sp.]|nr:TIGR03915 family putative DNA repair protein [Sulfurovum sp.]
MLWLYDGSFEGFLTALHRSYMYKCIPETLTPDIARLDLLSQPVTIETDLEVAKKVSQSIAQKFPKKLIERVYHVFLCDDVERERELLLYLRMGFKDLALLDDLSHPVIYAVEQYQKRVFSTMHKMHAFTRFEMLEDGLLYAKIAPPCNVLPLLGKHFVKRLGSECFIIHDIQRGWIVVYNGKDLQMHEILDASVPILHQREKQFQKLWKTFFDTVAIESRKNYKVQRNFVPLLYRGLMTEFSNFS